MNQPEGPLTKEGLTAYFRQFGEAGWTPSTAEVLADVCLGIQNRGWTIPVPMVLHCPACGTQHIDEPNPAEGWDNPPHKSHKCGKCSLVWRPADVPTAGVRDIETQGKADTWAPFHGPDEADGGPAFVSVTVNGRGVTIAGDWAGFSTIVGMARPGLSRADQDALTVAYFSGVFGRSGTLLRGQRIGIRPGMVFNVSDTSKA